MAKYSIVPAEESHLRILAQTLRSRDRDEARAAGFSPIRAVSGSFRRSLYRRSVFVDGALAAMWGVGGAITIGEVWLLTSPAIEKIPFGFAREGLREVSYMFTMYDRLRLAVHCNYSSAIRLATLWGFRPVSTSSFIIMER